MSEPAAPATDPNPEPAFGDAFSKALAEAFGESGVKIEPANPEPDTPKPDPAPADPKPEPAAPKPEPVSTEPEIPLPIDNDDPLPEPVADEPEDVTGMTKAAGERFKTLRLTLKEANTKLAAAEQAQRLAEARAKELEAQTGMSEDVKKKLETYETELAISRLEATDAYKKAVTAPLADIAAEADAVAKKYTLDADKLLDAISVADQQKQDELFEDLLSGVSERDKLKIYACAERLPSVLAERARLYSDRDAALAEIDAAAKVAEQTRLAEAADARKAAVSLVHTRVLDKIPFLKDEKFATDALRDKVATEDFDALDVTNRAYNAYAGGVLPSVAKAYAAALQEIETLTDELGKLKRLDPTAAGGRPSTPAPVDDPNESIEHRINRQLSAAGI